KYGDWAIEELIKAGVDCRFMQQMKGHQTPVSFIVVNRSIASRTIINRKRSSCVLKLNPGCFDGLMPKLLLFDGHELEASMAALDAFPSAMTVLDAGSLREGTKVLAERVHYLVCSERFAVQVTGNNDIGHDWKKALHHLRELNRGVVVVTL